MTDISNEIDSSEYANQTEDDIIHNLTVTVDGLHHIGTSNSFLTDEDKVILQYAHDVLKAIRNGQQEARKLKGEESPPVIVTARKGAMVRAVSGLRFRGE